MAAPKGRESATQTTAKRQVAGQLLMAVVMSTASVRAMLAATFSGTLAGAGAVGGVVVVNIATLVAAG